MFLERIVDLKIVVNLLLAMSSKQETILGNFMTPCSQCFMTQILLRWYKPNCVCISERFWKLGTKRIVLNPCFNKIHNINLYNFNKLNKACYDILKILLYRETYFPTE